MADREPVMPGRMPSSFDGNDELYNEKPLHKAFRKLKEEPLVPLGIGLTVFAFISAYRAVRRGDSQQANRMFRARVAAQGFTVIAMVAGSMYYSKDREKSKELRALKEQRDAEEKRQKWIRELEVRDEEEKAMRLKVQQRLLAAQEAEEAAAKPEPEKSGGILSKMNLWPRSDKDQAQEPVVEETTEGKPKKSSSTLDVIGENVLAGRAGRQPTIRRPRSDE